MSITGADLTTEQLIKEAKAFRTKKNLGQHFLIDAGVLQLISDTLDAQPGDTIVEIGPGIGFLTRFLSRTGARIVAVDLDREAINNLKNHEFENVEYKHGDFLRFDLNTLEFAADKHSFSNAASASGADRIKVVGNVPYQITGLILGHLLGEIDEPSPWLHRIAKITLTVQYEVAKRLVAAPGDEDYSKVSILVAAHSHAKLELKLPASAFYPPPEVNSAVVSLVPRTEPLVKPNNPLLMRQLIEAGFRQRRKMLRNGLSFLHMAQSDIDEVFASLRFDPQTRAERMSLEQFAMLSDAIESYRNDHGTTGSTES